MKKVRKTLHSKDKGTLGELLVAFHLLNLKIPTFKEIGDNSKTDLIAIVKDKCVKIQVKAFATQKNNPNIVCCYSGKSAKGYKYQYKKSDFDVMAVYVYDKNIILFIPAKKVIAKSCCLTIRFNAAANNNTKKINSHKDYLSFFKSLK